MSRDRVHKTDLLPLSHSSNNILPNIHNHSEIKLPKIHNHSEIKLPKIRHTFNCNCCELLRNRGCSNTIHKNGHKIWYVLHNLVENMPNDLIVTNDEQHNMLITIHVILSSIPCIECKSHSLHWYNDTLIRNKLLHQRNTWIFLLWQHHNNISNKIILKNPYCKMDQLSWIDYKHQIDINRITCKNNLN